MKAKLSSLTPFRIMVIRKRQASVPADKSVSSHFIRDFFPVSFLCDMTVVLCKGSQELNMTNSSLVMSNPLFRRLLPFLLIASAAFVFACCSALFLKLLSSSFSKVIRSIPSDGYLLFLAFVGCESSIVIGAFAIVFLYIYIFARIKCSFSQRL